MKHYLAIAVVLIVTAAAWMTLGIALTQRTDTGSSSMGSSIASTWGPPLAQCHPTVYYESPVEGERHVIEPEASEIEIIVHSDPKTKGLRHYRTYTADFSGTYQLHNPTPITQTVHTLFRLPGQTRYEQFSLSIGDKKSTKAPTDGQIIEATTLAPGEVQPLHVSYRTTGLDTWRYAFQEAPRVRGFELTMTTDFDEIDFPSGTESPTAREPLEGGGWKLDWDYGDVIGAGAIGMAMPAVVNPGPVAARITFFAPFSLVFFFAVILIAAALRGIRLHAMNYLFLACGCFAFQLLFAYLVDLIPVHAAFAIAASVSLALVSGYLWLAAGFAFARIAAIAQFAYMVLFSYSFFFPGTTGITLTVGAIITLAGLMAVTAKTDWETLFETQSTPDPVSPPMPTSI